MSERLDAAGAAVYVERSAEVPLVWLRVSSHGGSASDPVGKEGLTLQGAMLARRGAGARNRTELDQALDVIGASIDVSASRDSTTVSALCLARHLDTVVDAISDILADPRMEAEEHGKLLRETHANLDDLRDDDSEVADRFFARHAVPGTPYSRTAMGNATSLAAFSHAEVTAARARHMVRRNLVIGLAGKIDATTAERVAGRIVERLSDSPPPDRVTLPEPSFADGPKLYLIDKPERVQSQIRIGHATPAYATDDFRALTLAETIFGGTFTSRLMQEIRVARGWSYGASCSLGRTRGPNWLRLSLAPSAEVTADAVVLVHQMYAELVEDGITDDELEFARSHLVGSMPFYRATAPQRMRLALRNQIFGLDDDFADRLADSLAAVTRAQVNEAIARHLRPNSAVTVIVATADTAAPRLEAAGLELSERLAYDSY